MQTEPLSPKTVLRNRFLEGRAAIPARERRTRSERVARQLYSLLGSLAARHVASYRPQGAEIDPGVHPDAGRSLGTVVYYPVWQGGAHHFVSPQTDRCLAQDEPHVVMLVPGLAFDLQGNRLGRGAGWYDQTLPRFSQAVRIGVAFDEQLVERLPTEPWDVPMHFVVTDARLIAVDGLAVRAGECADDST